MKIVVFIDRWSGGGIENYWLNHLKHLDRDKNEFILLTTQKETCNWDGTLAEMQVPLVSLLAQPEPSPIARTMHAQQKLYAALEKLKPDVLWLNLSNSLLARSIPKVKKIVPYVALHAHSAAIVSDSERWSAITQLKRAAHAWGRMRYIRRADAFFACSHRAADWMYPPEIAKKATILLNGIDTARFAFCPAFRQTIREQLGWQDKYILGIVARIEKEKNPMFLVSLMEQLQAQPEICMLVAGDGSLLADMRREAARKGMEKRFAFVGAVTCAEQYYSAMDCFVLPSISESFGLSAAEAQCAGLPCVVSAAVPQAVNLNGMVRYIPLSEPESWANALRQKPMHTDIERTKASEKMQESQIDIKYTSESLAGILQDMRSTLYEHKD